MCTFSSKFLSLSRGFSIGLRAYWFYQDKMLAIQSSAIYFQAYYFQDCVYFRYGIVSAYRSIVPPHGNMYIPSPSVL
jgi:hypothetical protein